MLETVTNEQLDVVSTYQNYFNNKVWGIVCSFNCVQTLCGTIRSSGLRAPSLSNMARPPAGGSGGVRDREPTGAETKINTTNREREIER